MARAKLLVSKSDIIGYRRCPYAWWLVDTGQLTWEDTLGPIGDRLVGEGQAFHELVEAAAEPVEISELDLASYIASADERLLGVPPYRNTTRKLIGVPDGVEPGRGAAIPIEIKSHRDV